MSAPVLPLLVGWQLAGRRALVIGGGDMAARRVRQLSDAGARVRVVTPDWTLELAELFLAGAARLTKRRFEARDLERADLVVDATGDGDLARDLHARCRAARLPYHAVDRPALCDFVFPAVHRDGPLQIAVSSGGAGPALAARLRDRIARALPPHVGEAVRRFGEVRRLVRELDPTPRAAKRRMRFLANLAREFAWPRLATLTAEDHAEVRRRYAEERGVRAGARPEEGGESVAPAPAAGRVQLVGAGPGDPALLTLAALEALRDADLVVADRLISPEIVALVEGELVVARKLPGRADAAQAEIDDAVVAAARAGKHVVRLKSGDPFLFGRAGEELEALARHGLRASVVPGIQSPQGAAAARGIPLTLRGVATGIVTLTATARGGSPMRLPGFDAERTFAFLMGFERLDELCAGLVREGFPPDLPAAVVSEATCPTERAVRARLADLGPAARRRGLRAPAVVLVGAAVAHGRFSAEEDALSAPPHVQEGVA